MGDHVHKNKRNIDKMYPIKSFRVNERREAWITNEALEAINDKDKVLSKAKRTGKPDDWFRARELRNRVGRDSENLKADFVKQSQEANKGDLKKFWKEISAIVPNKKAASGKIWLKDPESGLQINADMTEAHINSFFTHIGPNLAKVHNKVFWGVSRRLD